MRMYYDTLFAISIIMAAIYAIIWRKRFSAYITLIFFLIPITICGYISQSNALSVEEAISGIKLSYQGASFLLLFMMLAIFDLCNLNLSKLVKLIFFFLACLIYLPVLTVGSGTLFYKSISLKIVDGSAEIIKEYGPFHTVFYVFLGSYLGITIAGIIYSLIKRKEVSKKNLLILLFCELSAILMYVNQHIFHPKVDFSPLSYIISEMLLLIIIRRVSLYDITESAIDTFSMNGGSGYISFDNKFTYIASNKLAKEVFPSLKELWIDSNATKNEVLNGELIAKIRNFAENNSVNFFYKEVGEKIYKININYLYAGKRKQGYLINIEDDSQNQKYISFLNKFSDRLQDEVAKKTEHIEKMHNNLILSMAMMVESRDNSTGGHIKRTSDIVKILLDEIMKDTSDDAIKITKRFYNNLIKAAPMHDLGKIAVDDAILRKPGVYTGDEYEIMKTHTSEGAKIVHKILEETDDAEFRLIAENVAHYHHEYWDGSGYPEGLKGEEIPLEARIMAIADVCDALISKRFYKEGMNFEEADKIIMEGMGKHFDKRLEKYYLAARPKLQAYYNQSE
ncbi:MAG: HD domain-containing protein [Treponema sp.]|nr:HD domain-containing protein [Treponema sp.]